jgi:hypothetical protein
LRAGQQHHVSVKANANNPMLIFNLKCSKLRAWDGLGLKKRHSESL